MISDSTEESPIAFRTRGTCTFEEAATNGFCKLCAARFQTMEGLWTHLRDEHSEPSKRKTMAMEAFPIFFRLDRLHDVLPTQNVEMSPSTPMRTDNCSLHGSPRVLESTRIEELLVAVPATDPPTPQVPSQPSPTETSVARLPEESHDNSTPRCAVASTEDSDLSVPCMSCMIHSSLTVDQLVSPQPATGPIGHITD
ncbi:hypothetical protein TNIN_438481 [Trichonephila inaurata madagascariensis]|uniref:C2H2-type domain-containing protein n=1 Tax=Trichonephila inaurata madagascariensis TaxID=2747483 RepID=A0A8X6WTU2_9ARAC|nr:hypothetical protein TNIN_438481 [Trichonephila inaurata madagascariensis]